MHFKRFFVSLCLAAGAVAISACGAPPEDGADTSSESDAVKRSDTGHVCGTSAALNYTCKSPNVCILDGVDVGHCAPSPEGRLCGPLALKSQRACPPGYTCDVKGDTGQCHKDQCETASDCHGILPQTCELCGDRHEACAHFACVNHQCKTEICEAN